MGAQYPLQYYHLGKHSGKGGDIISVRFKGGAEWVEVGGSQTRICDIHI